jgi:hypothetical protein
MSDPLRKLIEVYGRMVIDFASHSRDPDFESMFNMVVLNLSGQMPGKHVKEFRRYFFDILLEFVICTFGAL